VFFPYFYDFTSTASNMDYYFTVKKFLSLTVQSFLVFFTRFFRLLNRKFNKDSKKVPIIANR